MISAHAAEAAKSHAAFFEQSGTELADALFRESAIAAARAIHAGVTAVELARLYGRSTEGRKGPTTMPRYTSSAAVGYFARTGQLLQKPPPTAPVSAREVQTAVREVCTNHGTRVVDDILSRRRSQKTAYAALQDVLVRAKARRREMAAADPHPDLTRHLDGLEQLLGRGIVVTAPASSRLMALASRAAALVTD